MCLISVCICMCERKRDSVSEREEMEIEKKMRIVPCVRERRYLAIALSTRYNSMYIFCLIRNSSFLLTFYNSVFCV